MPHGRMAYQPAGARYQDLFAQHGPGLRRKQAGMKSTVVDLIISVSPAASKASSAAQSYFRSDRQDYANRRLPVLDGSPVGMLTQHPELTRSGHVSNKYGWLGRDNALAQSTSDLRDGRVHELQLM
jgi:hypothetical protein